MTSYLVRWVTELEAESPEAAAQKAFEILRDVDNTAQLFYVFDAKGSLVASVDLMDQERR